MFAYFFSLRSEFYSKNRLKHKGNLTVMGPMLIHGKGDFVLGNGVTIRSKKPLMVEFFCDNNAKFEIGDNVFINWGVRISASNHISIGTDVMIGDETLLLDNDYHGLGGFPAKTAPIVIGDNSWIGARCILLKGVHIGTGSVVGAGSVVTKSIPEYVFAAGNPARVVRQLDTIR